MTMCVRGVGSLCILLAVVGTGHAAVPVPPGVPEAALRPMEGEARERATATLEAALEGLGVPSNAAEAVGVVEAAEIAEPPLAVQRAYAAARVARQEGRNVDAIRELQGVLRLAPREPAVLRMLGEAYAEAGNPTRGGFYLEQAVQRDPGDVNGRFALGRMALQGRQFAKAVRYFHEAAETIEAAGAAVGGMGADGVDAGRLRQMLPVIHFFMGTALEGAGYSGAAIELFQAYLDAPRGDAAAASRELAVLDAQRPRLYRALGDLEHRLGDPAAALRMYIRAMTVEALRPVEPDGGWPVLRDGLDAELAGRLVYTQLMLDDGAGAREAVLRYAASPGASPEQVGPLVDYLGRASGGLDDGFVGDLMRSYREAGRPMAVAAALMGMLDAGGRAALLREHLEAHPGDVQVLRQALDYVLGVRGDGGDGRGLAAAGVSDLSIAAAVGLTLEMMSLTPPRAVESGRTLLSAVSGAGGAERVLEVLEAGEGEVVATQPDVKPQAAGGMGVLLRGLALAEMGRRAEAEVALERAGRMVGEAVGDDAGLRRAVTVERVKLAVADEAFERAEALLETLPSTAVDAGGATFFIDDAQVLALRVGVLRAMDRPKDALALLDRLIEEDPTPSLALQKAVLLDATDEPGKALETLRAAIARQGDAAKEEEPDGPEGLAELYDAAITLVEERRERVAADFVDVRQSLMRELFQRLPRARLTRQRQAQEALLAGDVQTAETTLRALVAEDRKDLRAAAWLRELLKRTGREAEGTALWERTLLANQELAEQPLLLVQLYQETNRMKEAERVLRQALERPGRQLGSAYAAVLAGVLVQTNRAEEALPLLEEAERNHPADADRLASQRASILADLNRLDEAIAILDKELAENPQNPNLNNSLAYTLAYHDRDLDRADRLVTVALDAQGQEASFLDTRGWVRYKQGEFAAAVTYLKNSLAHIPEEGVAMRAVVNDHLGDAHWRIGQRDAAVAAWGLAAALAQGLPPGEREGDRELRDLPARASAKQAAAGRGEEPAVAISPGLDERGPRLGDVEAE